MFFRWCYQAQATLSDYRLLGDSKDFTKHMQVCYEEARNWCLEHHEYLHMTGLTKDLLGLDTMADFPVGCLCMFQSCFGVVVVNGYSGSGCV